MASDVSPYSERRSPPRTSLVRARHCPWAFAARSNLLAVSLVIDRHGLCPRPCFQTPTVTGGPQGPDPFSSFI